MDEYLEGVQGSPAVHNQPLRFTPALDCPSVLYYQCTKQKNMGYKIYVVDSQEQVGRPIFVPRNTPAVYDDVDEHVRCVTTSIHTHTAQSEDEADVDGDGPDLQHVVVRPTPSYRPPPVYQRAQNYSVRI